MKCSVNECFANVKTKSLCKKHYTRLLRNGSVDDTKKSHADQKTRFYRAFTVSNDGCWNWNLYIDAYGYGGFERKKAHRKSWEIHFGLIPENMHVLHKCDNRKCVNPEHLFLGTNADNMSDKMEKGRYVLGDRYKGERNINSKLTNMQALEIRASSLSYTELANKFNVSKSCIANIKKSLTYKGI